MPCAIPCSLSSFVSRIHSFLFPNCRCTVSPKFFDTQVPSVSTEELVLPRHARCVLFCLRCNGHSQALILIELAESRILHATPADIRPRTPPISFGTVQLGTLRSSLFGDSLSLYDFWSRPWRVATLPWSSTMLSSLERGRVTTKTTTTCYCYLAHVVGIDSRTNN